MDRNGGRRKKIKKDSTGTKYGLAEFGINTGIQKLECCPVIVCRIFCVLIKIMSVIVKVPSRIDAVTRGNWLISDSKVSLSRMRK